MDALAQLPVIRPITDMRTNLNDVCRQATETQEPIVLTKNGTASYVLMDSDAYDAAGRRNRVYLSLIHILLRPMRRLSPPAWMTTVTRGRT